MNGRFITFEGVEGAGKSTVVRHAVTWLEGRGHRVTLSREPGGTPVAEAVRDLLLDPRHRGMSDVAELLLVFAARADHLDQVIRPALQDGHWVILDRFTDATYAYQGGGRGLANDMIAALETLVQGSLRPDRTFLLDLPVPKSLARSTTPAASDRFELEQQAFFERVRAGYLERVEQNPDRMRVIDAAQPLAAVVQNIERELQALE